jgi:hypothetical protein
MFHDAFKWRFASHDFRRHRRRNRRHGWRRRCRDAEFRDSERLAWRAGDATKDFGSALTVDAEKASQGCDQRHTSVTALDITTLSI